MGLDIPTYALQPEGQPHRRTRGFLRAGEPGSGLMLAWEAARRAWIPSRSAGLRAGPFFVRLQTLKRNRHGGRRYGKEAIP